jgi:hypothetical protein
VTLGEGQFLFNLVSAGGCTWARLVSLFAESPRSGLSAKFVTCTQAQHTHIATHTRTTQVLPSRSSRSRFLPSTHSSPHPKEGGKHSAFPNPSHGEWTLLQREQNIWLSAKDPSSTRAKYLALGEGVAPTSNGKRAFGESQGRLSTHIRRDVWPSPRASSRRSLQRVEKGLRREDPRSRRRPRIL